MEPGKGPRAQRGPTRRWRPPRPVSAAGQAFEGDHKKTKCREGATHGTSRMGPEQTGSEASLNGGGGGCIQSIDTLSLGPNTRRVAHKNEGGHGPKR